MYRIYLNQVNKEKSATLLILLQIYEHFQKQEKRSKELFGSKGWGWLKTSKSFLMKAVESFAETIGPEEWSKVHKLALHSDFVVMSKNVKAGPAELVVKSDTLYDLAEIAMGKECVKCIKCEWKKCNVFKALQGADIPAAQEVKNDCPYRQ
jgi:hypothetical protein